MGLPWDLLPWDLLAWDFGVPMVLPWRSKSASTGFPWDFEVPKVLPSWEFHGIFVGIDQTL